MVGELPKQMDEMKFLVLLRIVLKLKELDILNC